MFGTPWADLFVERGGPSVDLERSDLEARLRAVIGAASFESASEVPAAALVAELARRAAAGEPWQLDGEPAQELGLACGCVAGERLALARLDDRYLAVVRPAVAHMSLGAAAVDEIRHEVRRKLLVPDPAGEIKLVRYAGRGQLRGLVKVVAVRIALDRLRRDRAEPTGAGEELERLASPVDDPELHFLKAHYREAFRAAFARAVGGLERRDRNILRLHLVGGMTLEDVAKIYGVHRSTVVRGLHRTRKHLFTATRNALREDLDIDRDDFDSVMGLIRSRLDVSLGPLLRTVTPPEDEDELDPAAR